MNDAMTGVLDSAAFDTTLPLPWRQALRDGQPLLIARVELGGASLEGAQQDALIVAAAETLRDMAQRPLDLVARLGTRGFVCCWYGVPADGAEAFVREVHGTLNDRLAAELPGAPPETAAVIGALHLRPSAALDLPRLHAAADALLRQARAAGPGRPVLLVEGGAGRLL